jgi:hypothetical protein
MKGLSVCIFVAFAGVASAAFTADGYTDGCFGSGCGRRDTNRQQVMSSSGSTVSNGLFNGSFTVSAKEFSVANGNEEAITGQLVQTSDTNGVPAPGTWVLVLTATLFVIVSRLACSWKL